MLEQELIEGATNLNGGWLQRLAHAFVEQPRPPELFQIGKDFFFYFAAADSVEC
jgi:hypothetical protein